MQKKINSGKRRPSNRYHRGIVAWGTKSAATPKNERFASAISICCRATCFKV